MKINFTPSVNFTAILKDYSPVVKKYDKDIGIYNDEKVSFVEIDTSNKNDIKALRDIAFEWCRGDTYAGQIYDDARQKSINRYYDYENKLRFYAITSQKDDFDNLDYKKILAVCKSEEKSSEKMYLNYLQVKPSCIYERPSNYKMVGTGFLDSLKKYYDEITLTSLKLKKVLKFYKNNGFMFYKDSYEIKPLDENAISDILKGKGRLRLIWRKV